MQRVIKIAQYILILTLLILSVSCASANKNPYYQKKKKAASHLSTTQLGRNRYYFSKDYQKRLEKSVKRKKKY